MVGIKFTLGKDVTLTSVRECCAALKESAEVEPLHRVEPGVNIVRVGDSVYDDDMSLRLNPAREGVNWLKLYKGLQHGLYSSDEIEDQRSMARGSTRKQWPTSHHTWVEERAEEAVFKAGDRVILRMGGESTPGLWVLDLMDAFAAFFGATAVVKYTARNKTALRRRVRLL